jgi:hypothetical protein
VITFVKRRPTTRNRRLVPELSMIWETDEKLIIKHLYTYGLRIFPSCSSVSLMHLPLAFLNLERVVTLSR